MERTFIAIKPDGVKRALIGKIISRIEDKGFKIVAMKMLQVDENLASKHYAEHIGKPFYPSLVAFITSGPIIAMVVEGEHVISDMRQLMGKTNPQEADVGTIRGDFSPLMTYNIIHGSDSAASAEREINLYFKPEEICSNWHTMYELLKADLS